MWGTMCFSWECWPSIHKAKCQIPALEKQKGCFNLLFDYALVVLIIQAFPFFLLLSPLSLPFFPFVQRVVYEITNTKWDLTCKGLDPKN